MKKIELEVYGLFDMTIGISEADCKELVIMNIDLNEKVRFVTFTESPWDHQSKTPQGLRPWSLRKNLIFVGNGQNPTNVHAMNWYLEEVAPEMEQGIPGVKTYLVGPGWDGYMNEIKDKEKLTDFFTFKGPLTSSELESLLEIQDEDKELDMIGGKIQKVNALAVQNLVQGNKQIQDKIGHLPDADKVMTESQYEIRWVLFLSTELIEVY